MAASSFFDRVKVGASAAPGTGAFSIGAAISNYRDFAGAQVPDGAVISYVIEDSGGVWECGQGKYAAGAKTVTRTTVYCVSGGGNAPVNASASATLFVGLLAEDLAAASSGSSSGSASSGSASSGSASSGGGQTCERVWTVPPAVANWTAVLADSSDTFVQQGNSVVITADQPGGDRHSYAKLPLLSQNYQVDMRFFHATPANLNNPFVGMYLLKGTRAYTCGFAQGGLTTQTWNSVAFGSSSFDANHYGNSNDNRRQFWMRAIGDSGGNVKFYISEDGSNFYYLDVSNFLNGPADSVGFGVNANQSTGAILSIGCCSVDIKTS